MWWLLLSLSSLTAMILAQESTCFRSVQSVVLTTGNSFSEDLLTCPENVTISSFNRMSGDVAVNIFLENRETSLHALVTARENYPDNYDLGFSWVDSAGGEGELFIPFQFQKVGATRPYWDPDEYWRVDTWGLDEKVTYNFTLLNVERAETGVYSEYLHVVSSNGEKKSFPGSFLQIEENYLNPRGGTSRLLQLTRAQLVEITGLQDIEYTSFCVMAIDPFWSQVCDFYEDSNFRFPNTDNKDNSCRCANFIFFDLPPVTTSAPKPTDDGVIIGGRLENPIFVGIVVFIGLCIVAALLWFCGIDSSRKSNYEKLGI